VVTAGRTGRSIASPSQGAPPVRQGQVRARFAERTEINGRAASASYIRLYGV
jgi:hypothetical protein